MNKMMIAVLGMALVALGLVQKAEAQTGVWPEIRGVHVRAILDTNTTVTPLYSIPYKGGQLLVGTEVGRTWISTGVSSNTWEELMVRDSLAFTNVQYQALDIAGGWATNGETISWASGVFLGGYINGYDTNSAAYFSGVTATSAVINATVGTNLWRYLRMIIR